MSDDFSDLRDFLHQASIGGPQVVTGSDSAEVEQALARVLRRRRGRERRRQMVVSVGVAGGLMVALVLALGGIDSRPPAPPHDPSALTGLVFQSDSMTAREVFDDAASAAAGGGGTASGRDGVSSLLAPTTASRSWFSWRADTAGIPAIVTLTTVTRGVNGSLHVEEREGGPLLPTGRIGESIPVVMRTSPLRSYSLTPEAGAGVTAKSLVGDLLASRCELESVACALQAISERYSQPSASNALPQAELWRQLATMEGIRMLGTTTDRLGRRVSAVSADSADERHRVVVLIDPSSGRYLGSELMDLGPDGWSVTGLIAVAG